MVSPTPNPPLKSLHAESSLIQAKLERMEGESTDALIESLQPGKPGSLKARLDGTILDGHHRVYVLHRRGVDVNALPREIMEKEN